MTGSAIIRILPSTVALSPCRPESPGHSRRASPWPAGDETRHGQHTLGSATWKRCAPYLANTKSKSYELSYLRSNSDDPSRPSAPAR